MQSKGEASAPPAGFVHSALIYGSDAAFTDVALPFIEGGIEAGEPTLAAVQAQNIQNLRTALGGEPDGVTLLSTEEWYESSARSRDKFLRWAAERIGAGRVRLISEPPWAVGDEAQVRDWARSESVMNVAFRGMPVSLICPYDTRALSAEIVEHARSTHPEIAGPEGSTVNGDYEDPRAFCGRLNSRVERPEGEPSTVRSFGLADLHEVRQVVTSKAVARGLPGSRADELALAVNEIASNAVVHGRPPATLRIWERDGGLICEVSDAGDGIRDVMAGQLTPASEGIGGRGIWLSRMLCDAVEIRNGVGCTVSIHALAPAFTLAHQI
jgi:anti-sigma regulatory factor (Ser/Thr protein kinase)